MPSPLTRVVTSMLGLLENLDLEHVVGANAIACRPPIWPLVIFCELKASRRAQALASAVTLIVLGGGGNLIL